MEQAIKLIDDLLEILNKAKDYNKADTTFVQEMIVHHNMAIEMANKVLKNGKDSNIAKLANNIIKAQSKEITTMEKWLKDNNIDSAPMGSM